MYIYEPPWTKTWKLSGTGALFLTEIPRSSILKMNLFDNIKQEKVWSEEIYEEIQWKSEDNIIIFEGKVNLVYILNKKNCFKQNIF